MAEAAKEQKTDQKQKPKGKPRIHLLDELRGFAVFCMIFYHAFYSVGYIFGWELGKTLMDFFSPAEPFFAGLFIFISGISSNLSHSNIARGAKLFFIAYAVTVITYFAAGEAQIIRFGILHFLSICMMLYGIFNKVGKLVPMWVGFFLCAVLFVLTFNVISGSVGIPFVWKYDLPEMLYQTDFLYPLGFIRSGFFSSDYFPMLPWMFMFMMGGFFGRLAVQKKFPKFANKKHIGFFAFLGKHALIVYLLHQPVIYGICMLIKQFVK